MTAKNKEPLLPKKDIITKIDVKEEKEVFDQRQFILFQLANEYYAVDILQASEIIHFVPVTRIPGTPDFIRGVINLRGRILVVLDLERKIHLQPREETASTRIIVAQAEERQVGLIVDAVNQVIWIPVKDIKKPPKTLAQKVELDYLNGVAIVGDKLVMVLDLDKLFDGDELKQVSEIHDAYSKD